MNRSLRPRRPAALLLVAIFLAAGPANACDGCVKHSHSEDGHSHNAGGAENSPTATVQYLGNTQAAGAAGAGGSTPFTFAVVADTQGSPGTRDFVSQLAADIAAAAPDFTVFPGDLVGTGSVETYAEWDAATGVLGTSRYMVPGNHDLPGRPATNDDWQTAFSWLPDSQEAPDVTTADPGDTVTGVDQMDYYFDVGGARFISVTTDRDAAPGETSDALGGTPRALDWFQSVMSLPSTRAMDHLFVFTHHPISTHPYDGAGGTAGEWWKSIAGTNDDLDTPEATALFAGHWHFYQSSRPDPESGTLELIHGTGGGGFEGSVQDNLHGFSLITVDGPTVTSRFYGDANGSAEGWSFDELLDEYVITQAGGPPTGELTRYDFTLGASTLDSSTSPVSKQHPLRFNGTALAVTDADRGGVLLLGGGWADAKATGEGNLAVVGDLSLSLYARASQPLGAGLDNVLVAFGEADDFLNGAAADQEAANYAYQLSYTADGRLRLAWEYGARNVEEVVSTTAVEDPDEWRHLEARRDADNRTVAFFVDGERLGAPVPFDHNATGAGAGSLYLGALQDGASAFVGWLDEVVISSAAVTVLFGDLDDDGDVDLDDWSALKAGALLPLSGTSADYALGDLDLDGVRSLSDLVEFRRAFEQANGMTVEAALALVPEPTAYGLIIGTLAPMSWAFRWR